LNFHLEFPPTLVGGGGFRGVRGDEEKSCLNLNMLLAPSRPFEIASTISSSSAKALATADPL
jgi:hypothetical protein